MFKVVLSGPSVDGPASLGWVVIVVTSSSESMNKVVLDWSFSLQMDTTLDVRVFPLVFIELVGVLHCTSFNRSGCTRMISHFSVEIGENPFSFKPCGSKFFTINFSSRIEVTLARICKDPIVIVAVFAGTFFCFDLNWITFASMRAGFYLENIIMFGRIPNILVIETIFWIICLPNIL